MDRVHRGGPCFVYVRLKVIRIQFPTLVNWILRNMSRVELDCRNCRSYKVLP